MSETTDAPAQADAAPQPSEEELRAAYEAELDRITSAELILQTAASLLNLGARRLGLTGEQEGTGAERDLEQVRDAIDGVRGLLPILERRASVAELAPLRDALSQLQMSYTQQAPRPPVEQTDQPPAPGSQPSSPGSQPPSQRQQPPKRQPGPAEASGRLWVPGR